MSAFIFLRPHIIKGGGGVMRYSYRYRKNAFIFKSICIVIIIAVLTLLLDAKLRPSIIELAALEAQAVAESKINSAVEKYLSKHGIN